MELIDFQTTFFQYSLASARLMAAFTLVSFLGKAMLGGTMIRNGVVLSLALMIYPLAQTELAQANLSKLAFVGILAKEVAIGLVLGYLVNIPFWALESAGFFIDNQRGATMATMLNPMSESETSPLGVLLSQTLVTLFFSTGIFLIYLSVLYKSYSLWPISEPLPSLTFQFADLVASQLNLLMRTCVLIAAPVVIAMFLSEFGLALVSRFAPQLNVFILSMPIKSGVAIALLTVYCSFIIRFFSDELRNVGTLLDTLERIL